MTTRTLAPGGHRLLLLMLMPDLDPQTGAEGKWQRRVTDRTDMLVTYKVVHLRVDRHIRDELDAAANIYLGVLGIQVAVG